MYRYAMKIEYDGTDFHGWQKQRNLSTVQGEMNSAFSNLERDTDGVLGAGRTDSGVHAIGQVAHVDLKRHWPPNQLQKAINFYLKPKPISVAKVQKVDSSFHARFSAIERQYLYRIFVRSYPLTFSKNSFWYIKRNLDIEKMQQGANYLVGTHDFTTFRSSLCQAKSPVKSLKSIKIQQEKDGSGLIIEINFKARSFLHNQVRSIVGTLEKVGSGNWEPSRVKSALTSKNRAECGPVAPPTGLYLKGVLYDKNTF